MKTANRSWRRLRMPSGVLAVLGATLVLVTVVTRHSEGAGFRFWRGHPGCNENACWGPEAVVGYVQTTGELGGRSYWLRSPEEEKRVVMGLYNRYCIRCHGVDGRGIWDIPDVPDFTNAQWQASRSDGQLARATLEGRGAVMPPFRGTLTLEEAWGMARYLRTFVPGTEVPRPETGQPKKSPELPAPKKAEERSK
jgi:Cytochrome C oxidase, cbb3-type, subunit III